MGDLVLRMLGDVDPRTNHPFCLGNWIVIKARERILRLLPSLLGVALCKQMIKDNEKKSEECHKNLGQCLENYKEQNEERHKNHDKRLTELEATVTQLKVGENGPTYANADVTSIHDSENGPADANVPTILTSAMKHASTYPFRLSTEEKDALKGLLTSEQISAVHEYTKDQKRFNDLFRKNQGDARILTIAHHITTALSLLPDVVERTYRSCEFTNEQVQTMFLSRVETTDLWKDDAFLSTSIFSCEEAPDNMKDFAHNNCRFIIYGKTGSYIEFLAATHVAHEEEVLFKPGTFWDVIEVTKDEERTATEGRDCWTIELGEVVPGEDSDDE
jgi:hypothetical protein